MTKLDIEEWLITAMVIMYRNSSSMIRINKTVVEKFDVKVAVHQGSVLSPCLFVVFEALLTECRRTLPCDMLYVDDLVIIVESLVELGTRYAAWKNYLKSKELMVNLSKAKVLIRDMN